MKTIRLAPCLFTLSLVAGSVRLLVLYVRQVAYIDFLAQILEDSEISLHFSVPTLVREFPVGNH